MTTTTKKSGNPSVMPDLLSTRAPSVAVQHGGNGSADDECPAFPSCVVRE